MNFPFLPKSDILAFLFKDELIKNKVQKVNLKPTTSTYITEVYF